MLLGELQRTRRYDRLLIVAYSMGGLVARGLIEDAALADGARHLGLLLSVATPWDGHPAAELGVDYSPATVPSWHDVAPDSDYLRWLRATPFPAHVPFHLLFGYRSDSVIAGASGDGVVPLASQLEPETQRLARTVFGFPETHTSIVRSAAVAERLNAILAASVE